MRWGYGSAAGPRGAPRTSGLEGQGARLRERAGREWKTPLSPLGADAKRRGRVRWWRTVTEMACDNRDIRIRRGARVRLHYRLALPDGKVIESSEGGEPLEFVVGAGELPEGLEARLIGLRAGECRRFEIAAWQNVFGDYDEERMQELDRSAFPEDFDVKPNTVMAFAMPSGEEIPGLIEAVGEETVRVDFNHPLIGRDFVYEVRILAVEPPTATGQ